MLACGAPDNMQVRKSVHGGMELVPDIATLIEIDQPQPTCKTQLVYIFEYIVVQGKK